MYRSAETASSKTHEKVCVTGYAEDMLLNILTVRSFTAQGSRL